MNKTVFTVVVVVTQGGVYCMHVNLGSFHIKNSNFMHKLLFFFFYIAPKIL